MDNEHVSVRASQVLQIAFSLRGPIINPVTAGNNTCCSANKPEKKSLGPDSIKGLGDSA